MLDWQIGQGNVFLQERGRRSTGDVSDLTPGFVLHFIFIAGDAALDRLQADQRSCHASGFRHFQRCPANEFGLLHLAEAVEARLPNISRFGNLVSIKRELAFEAKRVTSPKAARDSAEFFSSGENLIPHTSA